MTTPRKLSYLVLVGAYAAVSLVCAFAHDVLPAGVLLLIGPPLLLIWGGDAWQLYLLLSIILAGLAFAVSASRTPEAKVLAAFAGLLVWFGGGFFALALSV